MIEDTFVYLYRVAELNVDRDVARADMLRIWEPDATWQALIDSILNLNE